MSPKVEAELFDSQTWPPIDQPLAEQHWHDWEATDLRSEEATKHECRECGETRWWPNRLPWPWA